MEEKNQVIEQEVEEQDELETDLEEEKEEKEVEFWQEDDEEEGGSDHVPLATFLKTKDQKKELARENEELRKKLEQSSQPKLDPVKRPRLNDYDSDEAYEKAMDEWESKFGENILSSVHQTSAQKRQHEQSLQRLEQDYESFVTSADELIKNHSINPETYAEATKKVVGVLDSIHPGRGDFLFKDLVSKVGDVSDKVVYHLGRNKAAYNEFNALMNEDPSGSRALVFLGTLKSKILTKKKSQAPAPSANLKGDSNVSSKERALKKKYQEQHKKGNSQNAYNAKKEAKAAGYDTSQW